MAYTRTPFKSYVRGLNALTAGTITTTGALTVGTTATIGTGLTLTAGQVVAPVGTAAAPSYAFAGRLDVGLYSAAANQAYLASSSAATVGTASGRIAMSAMTDRYQGLSQQGIHTPTQIAANTDNWSGISTTVDIARISSDAARDLTGIVAPSPTRTITLENVGAFTITLKHDVTSTAANRFYCPGNVDYALLANARVQIRYDTTSSRWRVG